MKQTLQYRLVRGWPRGAWVAHGRRGEPFTEVWHGSGVQTTPDWFVEGIWAGPFEAGELDRTDLVFGSGGRVRGGAVTFVSAGSTVDRIQSLATEDDVWIANSLAALLAVTGAAVDETYRGYAQDFRTIRHGLHRYRRSFPTTRGAVELHYFQNLGWDGERLSERPKPLAARDFTTFRHYRAFLDETLRALAANMRSPARERPLRFLGTISSGYDSSTVAVLARPHGLTTAITFTSARSGADDSGAAVAQQLGLTVISLARDAWRRGDNVELPFLASDAKGEDVYFQAAEAELNGSVLLTGFHGDKVWDPNTRFVTPDIVRGDQSGLSLTEYRLWAGFVHCPVPFFGVRQIADVQAISRNAELAPWDLGGAYNRPICRRIVEEAGVPRDAFGRQKQAVSVQFHHHGSFLSPASATDFLNWLSERPALHPSTGLVPGRRTPAQTFAAHAGRWLQTSADLAPVALARVRNLGNRLAAYGMRERLFRSVFPWAIGRVAGRYREALNV